MRIIQGKNPNKMAETAGLREGYFRCQALGIRCQALGIRLQVLGGFVEPAGVLDIKRFFQCYALTVHTHFVTPQAVVCGSFINE
jgi:hypothetical protein